MEKIIPDELIDYISKKTGLDKQLVKKVLLAERTYYLGMIEEIE